MSNIDRNLFFIHNTCSLETGASLVEFIVVAPVLLMLGLGTVQIGLLYHAKSILNYATFEAARKGAVSHADLEPMEQELSYRLAPVYGGNGDAQSAGVAISRSLLDGTHVLGSKIEIINPTTDIFDSWAVRDVFSNELQIPNHHLRSQDDEIRAGVTLHDANLLKIRSEYGYELKIPIVNRLITSTMSVLHPEKVHFYTAGRVPLTSVATVRMQNEVRKDGIELTAARSLVANSAVSDNLVVDGVIPNNHALSAIDVACDENGLPQSLSVNLSTIEDGNASDTSASGIADACVYSGPTGVSFLNGLTPSDNGSFSSLETCG